ncbi:MAG: hypothetical protein R6X25_12325 [Candidatus Krumholzibacteriia bacterium]
MRFPWRLLVDNRGYALFTVTVFAFIIILASMAFFAMASYETNQALYREESAEAFALADGAVERARAKFLADRLWTAGFDTTTGRGSYTLTVERQPYTDLLGVTHDHTVRLLSTGRVGRAVRQIEVWSALPLTFAGLTHLVMEDMQVQGNYNIFGGDAHINGVADFGRDDRHLRNGEYTSGFEIVPPAARTDPEAYSSSTYYRVRACNVGGPLHARIELYDRTTSNFVDVTTARGDSLQNFVGMHGGRIEYGFTNGNDVRHYFDQETGIFSRLPDDFTVIVNFGEPPVPPLDPVLVSDLDFQAQSQFTMRSTIINTRCWNSTAALETTSWEGGLTTVKQMSMEPINGLGLLIHDFQDNGMAGCSLGTDEWPSLTYVTGDVVDMNANGQMHGSVIVLGGWGVPRATSGGPDMYFDPDFMVRLPEYLGNGWDIAGSSTMHVLSWRELAADT